MKDLQRLMKLTNAGALVCTEALCNTDSFDEAVEYVRPVSRKSLKRGMIVTITNDCFAPSKLVGTTTKVLKRADEENVLTWEDNLGISHPLNIYDVVLLEDVFKLRVGMYYLNKPFFIENDLCLRPATDEEKANYRKRKKTINDEQ